MSTSFPPYIIIMLRQKRHAILEKFPNIFQYFQNLYCFHGSLYRLNFLRLFLLYMVEFISCAATFFSYIRKVLFQIFYHSMEVLGVCRVGFSL
jgi:hypothetical protein